MSDADGAFLAGFIEGEGCFSIVKQSRKRAYRCVFSMNARADDGDLLRELQRLTRIGSLLQQPARATSRPQVVWMVSAKSDCLRLVEILNAYPLRGRKSHDCALWKTAVEWWVDGDVATRDRNRDWGAMAYLKTRLEAVKRYEVGTPPPRDVQPGLWGDWPGYLAGFLTAEGCLMITPSSPGRLCPRAIVRLRADDRELLHELCNRTEIGKVYGPYENRGSSPVVSWCAVSFEELQRFADLLGAHRLRGRKAEEFAIWNQAVRAIANGTSAAVQRQLRGLKAQLTAARRFQEVPTAGVGQTPVNGT